MINTFSQIIITLPEIILLSFICVMIVLSVIRKPYFKKINYYVGLLGLVCTFGVIYYFWSFKDVLGFENSGFKGMFLLDNMAYGLKLCLVALVFLVFIYSEKYLQEIKLFVGEYFVLCLFSLLGMMILISAGHFLSRY